MRVTELSGGVGGARMSRGLAALDEVDLTVVVNVGDDADNHGLAVSPDLDTVLYTMAGVQGEHGWGRAGESFVANTELARFGLDNTFRLGDKDLALKIFRTLRLREGATLSEVMSEAVSAFGISSKILPATNDPVRTEVQIGSGWIDFQQYFVNRRHRDEVLGLRYQGVEDAKPAPGVLEAVEEGDLLVIAPSNPPLSIWPILAVPGISDVVRAHPRVIAVSPLIGGRALKGPAHRVMESLGLPPGNQGVAAAYEGLIDILVIDRSDQADADRVQGVQTVVTDTRIGDPASGARLAREIVS